VAAPEFIAFLRRVEFVIRPGVLSFVIALRKWTPGDVADAESICWSKGNCNDALNR
jgi:hypothetical protein